MNWKIKELRAAAKSWRKDLALLVMDGGSSRVLPGGSALNLHSHLIVLPPVPRASALRSACSIKATTAPFLHNHPRFKPPHCSGTAPLFHPPACKRRVSFDLVFVMAIAEFELCCSDFRPPQENIHFICDSLPHVLLCGKVKKCFQGFWQLQLPAVLCVSFVLQPAAVVGGVVLLTRHLCLTADKSPTFFLHCSLAPLSAHQEMLLELGEFFLPPLVCSSILPPQSCPSYRSTVSTQALIQSKKTPEDFHMCRTSSASYKM